MAINLGNTEIGKISLGNIEISKISLGEIEIWSSGFDGDFTKVDLWELGSISNTGAPVANTKEARTKDFHTIPTVGLNLLSINKNVVSWSFYGINVYFYNSDYGYISKSYININTLGNIAVPTGAKYYKLTFYNGIGAHRYPVDIQVHVPEANIKFNPE